jgi:hypothetical protein
MVVINRLACRLLNTDIPVCLTLQNIPMVLGLSLKWAPVSKPASCTIQVLHFVELVQASTMVPVCWFPSVLRSEKSSTDDEPLLFINKPKHPKKGENKEQNGRTHVQEDKRTT